MNSIITSVFKTASSISWNRFLPRIPVRTAVKRAHRREPNPAPSFPKDDLPNIAIIGRPNVGKSTLYNHLTSSRPKNNTRAIVHALPGVTRDSLSGIGGLGDLEFNLIDTAGVEGFLAKSIKMTLTTHEQKSASVAGMGARTHGRVYKILYEEMLKKTIESVLQADAVLFMIDTRQGLTPVDEEIAKWIKQKISAPSIIVASKCDGRQTEDKLEEFSSLYGYYDDIVEISTHQNEGFAGLYISLRQMMEDIYTRRYGSLDATSPEDPDDYVDLADWKPSKVDDDFAYNKLRNDNPIIVSVIGRPNAGKSTLINALLEKDFLLTGPAPGVTRDSKPVEWKWNNQRFRLVDTAGLRRRRTIDSDIEKLCVVESLRSLKNSHIVVLVIDAQVTIMSSFFFYRFFIQGAISNENSNKIFC